MAKIKTYTVIDNNRQECLNDSKNHYLAGMQGETGKTVKVLVQPFKRQYTSLNGKIRENKFIIGQSEDGNIHLIMYCPNIDNQ